MIERSNIQTSSESNLPETKPRRLNPSRFFSRRNLFIFGTTLVTLGLVAGTSLYLLRPAPKADPFTASTAASVQFPLYYPTSVPAGYRTDLKSVTEPTAGVVVFNMVGPNNRKLFCSEEARPKNPDIGGAYDKLMIDPKSVVEKDGSITIGKLKDGTGIMGSRINNKVWIICNSHTQIPLDQMQTMLESMKLRY